MSRKELEELLDDFIDAYEYNHDMVMRSDWVNWSEENERKAFERLFAIKDRILSLAEEND